MEDKLIKEKTLEVYELGAESLFSQKSRLPLRNCSLDHCNIINRMIVKYTENNGHVYFFTKCLNDLCFNDDKFLKEVDAAIKRKVHFHLACTDENCKAVQLLKKLGLQFEENENSCKNENNGHYAYRNVEPCAYEENNDCHFTTNGVAVRIETRREGKNFFADVWPNCIDKASALISRFNINVRH